MQIRALNDDVALKPNERCKRCKQVHLRPGYCQALDPINADKYPEYHRKPAITHQPKIEDRTQKGDDGDRTQNLSTRTQKTCEVCGKEFEAKMERAKFCSGACRARASRKGD